MSRAKLLLEIGEIEDIEAHEAEQWQQNFTPIVDTSSDAADLLSNLHISALGLATGIEHAWNASFAGDPHARSFLRAIFSAYESAGLATHGISIDGITNALRSALWSPSLSDLINAGLTTAGLCFMPAGILQVKLPTGEVVPMLPSDFAEGLERLVAAEERAAIIDAVQLIQQKIPGALVERWVAPLKEIQ